jgi:hypothetical protein
VQVFEFAVFLKRIIIFKVEELQLNKGA